MGNLVLQIYFSFFLVAIYECQKMIDRSQHMNPHERSTICHFTHLTSVNIQCQCNEEEQDKATRAQCWLFNELEPETSYLWDEFRFQKRLKNLYILAKCKPSLNYIPTRALTHLPELVSLNLLSTNITTVVPYAFANSSTLQLLELKKNNIQILERNSFANLSSLKEIDLKMNSIREVGRDVFRGLPSLKRLFLEENSINVVQDLAFSDLRSLEELTIFKNHLTAISRNTFQGLTSLRRLDLHSNLLSELKDFTFAEMQNLRELIVEQNVIENVGEKVFYGIPHLEVLVLGENKLHILPDNVFTSLPILHKLDLRDNLLQTFTCETARPILDKLKNESFQFHMEGNRVECDCNLSWLRSLVNETANTNIKEKLLQLSCYMKASNSLYFDNEDNDQEINLNGLSDGRGLGDGVMNDNRNHDGMSDVDRMYKFFNIPPEQLPCPEKRQAHEVLMEQMSKTLNEINGATSIYEFSFIICCISLYLRLFIS